MCSIVNGKLLEPSRKTNLTFARFEVLTAVLLKTQSSGMLHYLGLLDAWNRKYYDPSKRWPNDAV
jgi:hypothetical protein